MAIGEIEVVSQVTGFQRIDPRTRTTLGTETLAAPDATGWIERIQSDPAAARELCRSADAGMVEQEFRSYEDHLKQLKVWRYEDVIFDKFNWVRSIDRWKSRYV